MTHREGEIPVTHDRPMRADVVTEGDNPERVLKNAPKTEDGFFVVPKVVE